MPRFVVRILIPALLCLVAYGVGVFVGGLTPDVDTRGAERLTGLAFTTAERDSMTEDLAEYTRSYERMRDVPLPNSVSPALVFNPLPAGFVLPSGPSTFRPTPVGVPDRPDRLERLAFASVAELSAMIHARKITSTELTKVFLERLRRYGPELQCVVTLTDSLALAQAARADAELARGIDRGSLHGIPYGAKDLLAQKDYPTTWGSVPYQAQHLDETATVIRKLEEAGAVLVAKLTLGELAWGDVWFGGMTRNPWDAGFERLLRRFCGGDGGWPRPLCDRVGDLGLDRVAFRPMRHERLASDLRPREPGGGDGVVMEHGQDRADRQERRGLCLRLPGHSGVRPTRPDDRPRRSVPVRRVVAVALDPPRLLQERL
jgi:hypothetical protein